MKFPSLVRPSLCRQPVRVVIYGEGLTEDGAPEAVFDRELGCNLQSNAKNVLTDRTKAVLLTATLLFPGDIAPDIPVISGGFVELDGARRVIVRGAKARNPDGSVNYTRLDVS